MNCHRLHPLRRACTVDIGEAARRVGVSAAALRLYERQGLLPKPTRSAGNYRQYSQDDLRRARLVRRARRAGLSLRQIAHVIKNEDASACLQRVLHAHLDHLERERARLVRLHRNLRRWLDRTTD